MKDLIFCGDRDYGKMLEYLDTGLPYIIVSSSKGVSGYMIFFKKYSDFLRFKSLMGLKEVTPLFFA